MCVPVCQDAVCAEAPDERMCLKNPECSWCEGRCREYQPANPVTRLHPFLLIELIPFGSFLNWVPVNYVSLTNGNMISVCLQCGSTGCLGLARFLSDCQSCLVFSGVPNSLPRAPGDFGWCVQNDSCLPVSGMNRGEESSMTEWLLYIVQPQFL